jgi:hypothetical protein
MRTRADLPMQFRKWRLGTGYVGVLARASGRIGVVLEEHWLWWSASHVRRANDPLSCTRYAFISCHPQLPCKRAAVLAASGLGNTRRCRVICGQELEILRLLNFVQLRLSISK